MKLLDEKDTVLRKHFIFPCHKHGYLIDIIEGGSPKKQIKALIITRDCPECKSDFETTVFGEEEGLYDGVQIP